MARTKKKQVSESEDEYEVRCIEDHKKTKKGIEYWVSWVGYGEDANTWQPDDTMGDAQECVAAYWKKHPKHPDCPAKYKKADSPKKAAPKKRAVEDKAEASDDEDDEDDEEELPAKPAAKKPRASNGAKGKKAAAAKEVSPELESPKKKKSSALVKQNGNAANDDSDPEQRLVDKYAHLDSWDDLVREVRTVEAIPGPDRIRVQIRWRERKEFAWLEKSVARAKCPQRFLDFFESNLKFKEHGE